MIVNIAFWFFVLVFDLLVPVVMIFFGKEFKKNPPVEINPGYGYRTAMSSKIRTPGILLRNTWGRSGTKRARSC